jgi:hypothetical protein
LLHPRLPQSLIAHQIDRPMTHQPISLPQTIPYD